MKVILIGAAGKMGREFEQVCSSNGDQVVGIDVEDGYKQQPDVLDPKSWVIVDFSTSKNRDKYFEYAKANKIPYACFSTTVDDHQLQKMQKLAKFVPVLFVQNASKGVDALLEAVEALGKKLNGADVQVLEWHHKTKKDKPSGTAKLIESALMQNGIYPQTFSFRVGTEKGKHTIQFFLEDEMVEISHVATSRKIFALGAHEMTQKLQSKKRGFFNKI